MYVFCALVFHFGKHVDQQTDMGREGAGCFETEESQLLLLLSISQSLSLSHTHKHGYVNANIGKFTPAYVER